MDPQQMAEQIFWLKFIGLTLLVPALAFTLHQLFSIYLKHEQARATSIGTLIGAGIVSAVGDVVKIFEKRKETKNGAHAGGGADRMRQVDAAAEAAAGPEKKV